MIPKEILELARVQPGKAFRLKDYDTGWALTREMKELGKDEIKERARATLDKNLADLAEAQESLSANQRYSVLMVLQAMDAAGKDGTIKHVMSGVNPRGCQVFSFKKPTPEELDHNFLWRHMLRLPERGRIGIFNRSYYEDVLVVRVHPEMLVEQKLPPGKRGKAFWKDRYDDINAFERHLVRNGTIVLKFFLNVSKQEQKRRLLERLERADKHWKFSTADVAERAFWDQYMQAYEDALSATSTTWAPWYVVPADHKWITRAAVADILTTTIRKLDLRYPEVTDDQCAALCKLGRNFSMSNIPTPGASSMTPFHTILHPTDFDACSVEAFRVARALAQPLGAKIIAFHVVAPPAAVSADGRVVMDPKSPTPVDLWAKYRAAAQKETPGITVEYSLVVGRENEAERLLLDSVRNNPRGFLIVMGSHGRTGLGRLLWGSRAEEVMRAAPCPVMVVKEPQA